jgi:hypothetical protein
MANLLQQRALDEVVRQYAALYGLPNHKAFLALIIEKYLPELNLNSIDIEESIVDGSDDGGIDAIVIDDESEPRPHIYFFQSKYYQTENAFERQFEGSALDKIQAAVNDFVLHGRINKKYQNARLVDKLHSVKNLGARNPKYTIVVCSNSDEPSTAAKARLDDFISETNRTASGEYLSVVYLHLDKIARDLIAPQQKTRINISLQISGKYLTEDTGNVRLFIGAVEGKDLASLIEKHGDNIFERNVRGYLKQSNPVNQGIFETATGKWSPYFVYMNNGLTITCDKFSHAPITNSPVLDVENAQIVNGQQTARSLYKASLSKKLKPDVKVLVRIVETKNQELLLQIVEATNTQTRVTSRDLHSNDQIQKLIEQHLASKGYFYEARRNRYVGKETSKRVDAEIAAQAFYAIFFKQPAVAKDKKKILFGDVYDELFNNQTNPNEILYSFRLLKIVQDLDNQEKYAAHFTFLKDATLHIAALMDEVSRSQTGHPIDLDKSGEIETIYEKVIRALAALVKKRAEEEGDKYEHRRTFKDPETYGRAVEILELGPKTVRSPR